MDDEVEKLVRMALDRFGAKRTVKVCDFDAGIRGITYFDWYEYLAEHAPLFCRNGHNLELTMRWLAEVDNVWPGDEERLREAGYCDCEAYRIWKPDEAIPYGGDLFTPLVEELGHCSEKLYEEWEEEFLEPPWQN